VDFQSYFAEDLKLLAPLATGWWMWMRRHSGDGERPPADPQHLHVL
jgi:hypothetical protein